MAAAALAGGRSRPRGCRGPDRHPREGPVMTAVATAPRGQPRAGGRGRHAGPPDPARARQPYPHADHPHLQHRPAAALRPAVGAHRQPGRRRDPRASCSSSRRAWPRSGLSWRPSRSSPSVLPRPGRTSHQATVRRPAPRWSSSAGGWARLVLGLTLDGPRHHRRRAFYDLIVPARSVAAHRRDADHRVGGSQRLAFTAMALPTMQLTLAVTNGIVILLAFISDMFMVGAQMPQTLSTIGWPLPPQAPDRTLLRRAQPHHGQWLRTRPPRRHRAVGPRRCRRRHSAAAPRPHRDASHGHRYGAMAGPAWASAPPGR